MGIDSVLEEHVEGSGVYNSETMCSACEMVVIWAHDQLSQNQTKVQILNYISQVALP
jgi:hypothetical protein